MAEKLIFRLLPLSTDPAHTVRLEPCATLLFAPKTRISSIPISWAERLPEMACS